MKRSETEIPLKEEDLGLEKGGGEVDQDHQDVKREGGVKKGYEMKLRKLKFDLRIEIGTVLFVYFLFSANTIFLQRA